MRHGSRMRVPSRRGRLAGVTLACLVVATLFAGVRPSSGGEGEAPAGSPALDWRGFLPPPTPAALADRYRQLVDYSNVAVLKNTNSADSVAIADAFVALRGVPAGNVCSIATTTAEQIDRSTFDVLRADVEACLTSLGPDSVDYLVTTKGFPLKVVDAPDKGASVDSELALVLGPYVGWINQTLWLNNPIFGGSLIPFTRAFYGFYIVTRLTGYTQAESLALLDRATEGIGRKGEFVLDTDPTKLLGYTIGNTWMANAKALLEPKGFDVLLDQNNSFVTGRDRVAGYTSWGSNDATWYTSSLANGGFELDADSDGVPDGWTEVGEPGVGTVSLNTTDFQSGARSVQVLRNGTSSNVTAVSQEFTPLPATRYYAYGYANYSNVSVGGGVRLRVAALDAAGQVLQATNGTLRTGTSGTWTSLGQVIYEPVAGAAKVRVTAVMAQSSGVANFDDLGIIPLRPHFTWLPGALAETYVSTGGRSFTYGTGYGQSLVADLVRDGVTGTKGYVYEPYLSAVAHPDILFDRLTEGDTLGISYAMASEIMLSWMDLILGDPKFAPYNRAYVPDLEVSTANITVTPNAAVSGALIDITATVSNLGNYAATNVTASVYLGNPQSGGQLLQNYTVSLDYLASTSIALPQWDSLGYSGTEVCVLADAADDYFEVTEANNLACATLALAPPLAVPLVEGKNFVSFPLDPQNTSIPWVLRTIPGEYDRLTYFDAADSLDPWKVYDPARGFLDFTALERSRGYWINVTAPGGTTLLLGGLYPTVTAIVLLPGWNMVGYPAGTSRSVAVAFAGVPWTSVETFDPAADPYRLRKLRAADGLQPGKGVWVYVTVAAVWTVTY